MIKPAILYKEEIERKFKEFYYSDDFMYYTGTNESFSIEVTDNCSDYKYEFAVLSDKDEHLIGYISYTIDWYSSVANRFGIFSFDRGNPIMGKEVTKIISRLIEEYKLHKIEWRMISGNPVQKSYDALCKKYNGYCHILKDIFKDRMGNYHDDYIYEIFPNPISDELNKEE